MRDEAKVPLRRLAEGIGARPRPSGAKAATLRPWRRLVDVNDGALPQNVVYGYDKNFNVVPLNQ
jgi:hypothetical protein